MKTSVTLVVAQLTVGMVVLSTVGLARAGAPTLFDDQPNIFGTQPCSGGGCYTRYLRVADLDGDGDLDIVFPNGAFSAEPLVIYDNDGSGGFSEVSLAAIGGFAGNVHQIGIGDIDADGDLDLYAPLAGAGMGALFINAGDGTFTDQGALRLPAQPYGIGATRMGDLDDDGDLDLVIADTGASGNAIIYLNDGDGTFDALPDAIPFDVGSDINDLDLLDVDRDFDLDLLTNAHGGTNRIWINDGTGVFSSSAFASSGGLHYGPGVCDVDGDGDLDIWIDNQGPSYTERLWINDGTGTFTDVTVAQVVGNPGSDDNGIVCADTDNDGDMDAVVVALGTAERLLVNDGTGHFTYQPGAFAGPVDSSLWAEMGDLDGDHRIDIVTGQGESGSFLNRVHLGNANVPTDTTPPRILAVQAAPDVALQAGQEAITHYAVSDNAMSDMGPRLAAAYAEVDPAGADLVVPARFMGGDVFRVALPADGVSGTVSYRLCAEDRHGNTGCSEAMLYEVGDGGTGGTSDGSTDTGANDTGAHDTGANDTGAPDGGSTDPSSGSVDTTGDSADPTGGNASAPGDDDSGDDSGNTTGDTAGQDDAGGCSCRAPRSPGTAPVLALLGVLGLRRRRR